MQPVHQLYEDYRRVIRAGEARPSVADIVSSANDLEGCHRLVNVGPFNIDRLDVRTPRSAPCPGHDRRDCLFGTLKDGLDRPIESIAHPPAYPSEVSLLLETTTEVDPLDPASHDEMRLGLPLAGFHRT